MTTPHRTSSLRTVLAMMRPDSLPQPSSPETRDTEPRGYLFERMFAETWDQRLVTSTHGSRWPSWVRLAREIYRRQDEFDVIVTWSERLTLAYLALQHLYGPGKPHVALFTQFSKPNLHYPLRVLGRYLHMAVIFSSRQRRFAIEHGLIAPERLFNLHFMVDDRFYSPRPGANDVISSVGAEMRDYATLFEALDGTDLRCEVAAGTVRIPHRVRLVKDRRVPVTDLLRRPNPNVSIGYRGSLLALRDLYAQSRFVVVPLLPTKSDNGLTVMLEAMAMGKAIVCSRTEGQVDAIDEGRTGLFTPVGDAVSLRRTMVDLWHDPARAAAMGAAARAQVERHHSLEQFCANFVSAFESSMAGGAAPDGWWEAPSLIPENDLPGRLSGERPARPAVSATPAAVAHSAP